VFSELIIKYRRFYNVNLDDKFFYSMKRILVYVLFLIFVSSTNKISAQSTFWYETFGLGCNQGQLATAAVWTATNGLWTQTGTGANGGNANEWFVSATEAGRPVGACGNGCLNNAGLTNRSLHIGSTIPGPGFDAGAYYAQTASSNTDKRVESPVINCVGQNSISLYYTYFMNGVPGVDFGEALYNDGSGWTVLGPAMAPSVGGCAPNGLWTSMTYPLPISCSGNPNVRVGFRWQNSNAVGPGNISIAIDEVSLISPKLTFTVPPLGCPNVCFTANVVPPIINPTPASYSWAVSPGTSTISNSTSSAPCIQVPSVGIYTITGFALDPLSVITASTTQTISIVANIPFTLTSSPSTICLGETATLTAYGGVTYTWSPAVTSPTVGAQVIATPTGPICYTATGNDISGCPGIGSLCISLGGAPIINVAATASAVCNGFTSTLTASGANTYTWTGTSLPIAIFQPSVSVGPGTYTVCASSPGLPCNTCSVLVVATAPPLSISPSQSSPTTCVAYNFPGKVSQPVTLNCSGASVYNWAPAVSLNYSVGPSVIAKPPASVCYTVTGKTSVCSGSAIVCVTVIPQYTMDVIPKQPIICIGDSIKLKIANMGSVSIAPFTYNWLEPGNAPPPSIDDPLAGTITISPTNTNANVTYSAEAFDSRGCASDPRLVTVTVIPQPVTAIAIPTIITGTLAVQSNSICYVGSSTGSNPEAVITITANNTNGLPPQYSPTYTWIPPYSTTYSSMAILNTPNSFTTMIAAPIRTPAVAIYTIISGFNGIPGCRREDTVSIRVVDCRSLTSVSFTTAIENDTICSRTCVSFLNLTDTAAGGPQTYTWNCPGGAPAISYDPNPVICYNLPGKFNVSLTVHSPYARATNGSTLTKGVQRFIKVVDIPNPKILPAVAFNHDTIVRFGTSVALTATNALSYTWSPNRSISTITGSMVTVNPFHSQQYVLTGLNSKGCWSRDTINIIVIDDCGEMFVPNAFSPNADGYNDELRVRGICLESMTFMVFNRWGEKVFETADINVGWDGTFKGEPLNTGVFVFRLEGKTWNGQAYSLKGNVTLMR
jgi:gliding motility-associated-like protein